MHLRDMASDLRSGLIMGDFAISQFPGHEGRGAGKIDPPGVEKSMLIFEENV